MATNPEENADDDSVEEEDIDEEETDEEADGASKDAKKDSEADESEDDEDDDADSDDEDNKPLTRKDLAKILAKEANRRAASQRGTSKKRDLPDANRKTSVDVERIDRLEQLETKRQFGYENNLAPDEVDVVYRLVRKPRAKDLLDPIVKGALDGYRSDKRAKANMPSSNGRPARVTARDEKNMTPAEKRDRFTDRRRQILASKQR